MSLLHFEYSLDCQLLQLVHCQKWNSSICSFHFVEFPLFRNISLRSSCALQSFTIASTRNFSSFKSQNFYRQSNYQPVVFDTLQQHSSTFKGRKTSFNGKINIPILRWIKISSEMEIKKKIEDWALRQPGVVGWRPDFFWNNWQTCIFCTNTKMQLKQLV